MRCVAVIRFREDGHDMHERLRAIEHDEERFAPASRLSLVRAPL